MTLDEKTLRSNREFLHAKIKNEAFTWKKDAPILQEIDNGPAWVLDIRAISLQPKVLSTIAELFWHHYPQVKSCQIGGMETSAIPLIAAIVLEGQQQGRSVTGFYVRKSRKKSGLYKQIEGTLNDEPIILVDDLMNAGKSFLQQVELLSGQHKIIHSVFALVRFRALADYTSLFVGSSTIENIFTLEDFSIPLLTSASSNSRYFEIQHYFKNTNFTKLYVVPKSLPVHHGNHIYWGTDNGYVWCLDADTLAVIWNVKLGLFSKHHIFSDILIVNETIFVSTNSGTLFMLNLRNGAIMNRFSLGTAIKASPLLLSEHTLLIASIDNEQGFISALDIQSQKIVWQTKTTAPITSTGCVTKKQKFIFADITGTFYFGNSKGIETIRSTTTGSIQGNLSLFDNENKLAFTTMTGAICITSTKYFSPKVLFTTEAGIFGSPLIQGNTVYVACLDKIVYAIDVPTKTPLWVFPTKGRIFASPVIHNDVLYIGSNDARLYAVNTLTGVEQGFFQATERITTRIGFTGTGRILMTTFANELYLLSTATPPNKSTLLN